MPVALDTTTDAGTSVWTFLLGLVLWVAGAAVLLRFYRPGAETFSADEVGGGPEWRGRAGPRAGGARRLAARPLPADGPGRGAPVPGGAPLPGLRVAPRRLGQAHQPRLGRDR